MRFSDFVEMIEGLRDAVVAFVDDGVWWMAWVLRQRRMAKTNPCIDFKDHGLLKIERPPLGVNGQEAALKACVC